jgi:hypothetical protein
MATVVAVVALPTTRRDQTPLTTADIASVHLKRNGQLVAQGTPQATATQVTINDVNVLPGSYKYTATIVDQQGRESDPSQEVAAVVPTAAPSAPVIVSISIQ